MCACRFESSNFHVHVGRDAKLGQSLEVRPACVRPECQCVRARLLILSKHPLHPRSHAHSPPQGVTVEVFVNENQTPLTMTVDDSYRCTFASGKLRPDAVHAQSLGRILVSVTDVCVCELVSFFFQLNTQHTRHMPWGTLHHEKEVVKHM